MVYLKYVENVIPLSKLIGLLFLFCFPLLSILFLKTNLARPVMGTIFLVNPHRRTEIKWCYQLMVSLDFLEKNQPEKVTGMLFMEVYFSAINLMLISL